MIDRIFFKLETGTLESRSRRAHYLAEALMIELLNIEAFTEKDAESEPIRQDPIEASDLIEKADQKICEILEFSKRRRL